VGRGTGQEGNHTMTPDDFKVHSIAISHQPGFGTGGTPTVTKNVKFHVGNHGPFYLNYPASEGTADKVKSDIQAQVQEIQSIHELAH
jgi:hypothetical protein